MRLTAQNGIRERAEREKRKNRLIRETRPREDDHLKRSGHAVLVREL
jgi:hypothetical protein